MREREREQEALVVERVEIGSGRNLLSGVCLMYARGIMDKALIVRERECKRERDERS